MGVHLSLRVEQLLLLLLQEQDLLVVLVVDSRLLLLEVVALGRYAPAGGGVLSRVGGCHRTAFVSSLLHRCAIRRGLGEFGLLRSVQVLSNLLRASKSRGCVAAANSSSIRAELLLAARPPGAAIAQSGIRADAISLPEQVLSSAVVVVLVHVLLHY